MMLQLTDHLYVQLEGKIEDILIRVDKFIIPADFLILDCEADKHASIIRGRPFLNTGRVLIDFENDELVLRVNDQRVKINVFRTMKHPTDPEDFQAIEATTEFDPDIEVTCLGREFLTHLCITTMEQHNTGTQNQTDLETGNWMQHGSGISPAICMHKILLEDDHKPTVDAQRRLNQAMKDVVRKEILKWLDAGKPYYCFLYGYSGYNQIAIAPEDQSKTTFTYPYGTFAFRRMPFGLCNAPATFQRCMTAIFSDMNEDFLEIFMDDFSTFGIVLGHKISCHGMEVDRAKIEVISKLPPPTTVKGISNFVGHAEAFNLLKEKLVIAPIVVSPDWTLPFELMCNASDYVVGAVLGQRKGKIFHPIYCASKTLNEAEINYTTTEKELLAVIFTFDKFRSYLIGTKVTVHTDHSAIKYLLAKKDQFTTIDSAIKEVFPDEQILSITTTVVDTPADALETALQEFLISANILAEPPANQQAAPWYADYVNYIVNGIIPYNLNYQDQIIRRCVPEEEQRQVLEQCHSSHYGGHFGGNQTAAKVLQPRLFWPHLHRDAQVFYQQCDRYQRTGNISKRNEMPLQNILEVELFDVWGIDFMGPFPSSFGNLYILLTIDCVSKWVEAIATTHNDAKTVQQFLKKNIFTRFGVPRAMISDEDRHFDNRSIAAALKKLGVSHKLSIAYHPQTNGHAEVSNREIKTILENLINPNRKDQSLRLDDALWAYRTS
ncbi:hypothetical protein V6N12_028881 [Hibiscus sabdariffa]|uniref:RNA-directed DNA polymerase n=1 Tax=Hibiscus sabdariffa TaxID=183260 RepID=A0ABR2F736_9ROSI